MDNAIYLNRDLSWLTFNERVLLEAAKDTVPLLERIKFLSIYSSNLDEFYRVRMPVLMALAQHHSTDLLQNDFYVSAKLEINRQQHLFGQIVHDGILPALKLAGYNWIYGEPMPAELTKDLDDLFFNQLLAYINVVAIEDDLSGFFAENNKLYQAVILLDNKGRESIKLINVPSDHLSRLHLIE